MSQTLFLGVPFCAGQPHPGVALAPALFRKLTSSLNPEWVDLGDVAAPLAGGAFAHARAIQRRIADLGRLSSDFLALMGGDHGQALGSIAGMLRHHPDLVVVWIDAHADANVPASSPSGNMHGMPLAWLLGARDGRPDWLDVGLHPRRLIYVGPRSLDDFEHMLIQELDITWIKPADLRATSVHHLVQAALQVADPSGRAPVHVSLDVDALDASLIRATGTPVEGGLDFEDVEAVITAITRHRNIACLEIVEMNPELGDAQETRALLEWSRSLYQLAVGPQRWLPHGYREILTGVDRRA